MRRLTLNQHQLEVFADAAELARGAARHFAELATQHVKQSGQFTVALSGGSTPKALFSLLAEAPFADTLPWSSIFLFWGDERCVPPDHPDSNYHMTRETLLSKVPIPNENVFRIPAEDNDHDLAALNYETALKLFFQSNEPPRFDLVFLGMGADGHTASLFPQTAALHSTGRIAVANYVPKLQAHRITLTAETINRAEHVIFLIAGPDKAAPLKEVLTGAYQPETYPSQLIAPNTGSLLWLVDEAAASLLS